MYISTMNNTQTHTMDFQNTQTATLVAQYERFQMQLSKGNADDNTRTTMFSIMDVLRSRRLTQRDRNKLDKMRRVTELITNIPVGTAFEIYIIGFNAEKRVLFTGEVVGHTKSGNVKMKSNGATFKTQYHFQMTDKTSNFRLANSNRICRFN